MICERVYYTNNCDYEKAYNYLRTNPDCWSIVLSWEDISMYTFVVKQGCEISSFEESNIYKALDKIKELKKFPCNLVTKIKEIVFDTEIGKERTIEQQIVWDIDCDCKLKLSKKKGN